MSSTCDISICISSYKARDLLLQCLEAVYASPPTVAYEVIVVNDYSGDGTAEAVTERFPEVNFSENPGPVGIARGFNGTFVQATGRYILQLSADVIPKPGAIDALYEFMEAHPEAGMVGAQILNPDGTLQPCGRHFPTLASVIKDRFRVHLISPEAYFHQPYRNYDVVEEVDEMPDACLMVRRETYDQVGGLDENLKRFYDDVEWCLRIKKGGWKIYYVPQAQAIHFWYYGRPKDATFLIQTGYFSELYVFKKHYGRGTFYAMKLLTITEVTLRMIKWVLSLFIKPKERAANQERLRVGWQTIKMALSM